MEQKSRKKVVIGIDADTSKIGVAVVRQKTGYPILTEKIISDKDGIDRTFDMFEQLCIMLSKIMSKYLIVMVGIEDYGWFQIQRTMAKKGEVVGLIRYWFYQRQIPVLKWESVKKKKNRVYREECMIVPSQLSKFIFEHGNISSKGKSSRLMLEVFQKTGWEFSTDDECDAFFMCQALRVFMTCRNTGVKKLESIPIMKPDKSYQTLTITSKMHEPITQWLNNYIEM